MAAALGEIVKRLRDAFEDFPGVSVYEGSPEFAAQKRGLVKSKAGDE